MYDLLVLHFNQEHIEISISLEQKEGKDKELICIGREVHSVATRGRCKYRICKKWVGNDE